MASADPYALLPRKMPRQARSAATVEAIHQAAIQVLLSDGASRLTTTRVAERAGVSVGTMYQYFPHKQALLYAVVQQHLSQIADALEDAFQRLHGQSLAVIAEGLVADYLAATTPDIDASRALYAAALELDVPDITVEIWRRIYAALRSLLASSSDGAFEDIDSVTFVLQQALSGTVQAVMGLDSVPTASALGVLREQLPVLCRAYLLAACGRPAGES